MQLKKKIKFYIVDVIASILYWIFCFFLFKLSFNDYLTSFYATISFTFPIFLSLPLINKYYHSGKKEDETRYYEWILLILSIIFLVVFFVLDFIYFHEYYFTVSSLFLDFLYFSNIIKNMLKNKNEGTSKENKEEKIDKIKS